METEFSQPPVNKDILTINQSATIFRRLLASTLGEESPFANAPFVLKVAEKYLGDGNQAAYFTTDQGFGANIVVHDGLAQPNIDLNIQEGLRSRNLRKRIAVRLGKEDPTAEEIFQFAAGHEIGHLVQALADHTSLEDQNVDGMTEAQIDELKRQVDEYNDNVRENEDIQNAQEYFRSVFKVDIDREANEACLDTTTYSDEVYLSYVNSGAETNADFISLWIMGMNSPDIKTSPQNQGYLIADWQRWATDHRIDATHLT